MKILTNEDQRYIATQALAIQAAIDSAVVNDMNEEQKKTAIAIRIPLQHFIDDILQRCGADVCFRSLLGSLIKSGIVNAEVFVIDDDEDEEKDGDKDNG